MYKINITAVSYTEKHPAVLQVACGHTNFVCRDSVPVNQPDRSRRCGARQETATQ